MLVFPVEPGVWLRLRDLPGDVQVSLGPVGAITVTVHGNDRAQAQVRASRVGRSVHVSATPTTATTTGVGVHTSVSRSGGRISVTQIADSIGPGQAVVGAVIGGGRVVVNGVDVTDALSGIAPADTTPAGTTPAGTAAVSLEPARVTVTVPAGTGVDVEGCARTQVYDIAGPVEVDLSGQRAFAVRGATAAHVYLSGLCVAGLIAGQGDVEVTASGQSSVEVRDGRHGRLQVALSGQSQLDATGTFQHLGGHLSGMSRAAVSGAVQAHTLHRSGLSTATLNGRDVTR